MRQRGGGRYEATPPSETLKCTPVVRFAGSHKFPLGAIPDSWDGVKRAGHLFRPGSVPAPACRIRRIPERIRLSRSLSPFVLAARPAPRDGRLIRDDVLRGKNEARQEEAATIEAAAASSLALTNRPTPLIGPRLVTPWRKNVLQIKPRSAETISKIRLTRSPLSSFLAFNFLPFRSTITARLIYIYTRILLIPSDYSYNVNFAII